MQHIFRRIVKRLIRMLGIKMPVRFGSLRRVTPVSRSFGISHGRPIDRYYIESFIERHRQDIRGRVLEAGGYVNYTKQFGDNRVARGDVLYPKEGHPDGIIIRRLSNRTGHSARNI